MGDPTDLRTLANYLLVADDPERRSEWRQRLSRHGEVQVCSSVESARHVVSSDQPWVSFVLDVDCDDRDVHRLLAQLRRGGQAAPGLLVTANALNGRAEVKRKGFRWLPRSASLAEANYFVGFGLALRATANGHIASAVEALGRQKSLTPKQMELTAYAATNLSRDTLVARLGVSRNTVKTRVRQLLKIHQEETMDALGKSVLWRALQRATRNIAEPDGVTHSTPFLVGSQLAL